MLSLSDCKDHKIWNDFLAKEKDNQLITIAHNPSLGAILEKTFGYSSKNSLLLKDEKVIGVMPMVKVRGRAISIPHFSYGGPVLDSRENIKLNLNSLFKGRKFEIRGFSKLTNYFNDQKIIAVVKLGESTEDQIMGLRASFRRKIRSAEKKSFITRRGGIELLDDFYSVYSQKMLEKGSPPLGKVFFHNLLSYYQYGEVMITVLYDNDTIVSAGFTLSYLGFNELCWASSIREYDKFNVNSLMYWRIIQDSILKGYTYFSMGRSTKNSTNHLYKKQWRPLEIPIYFNYSEKRAILLKECTFLNNLWKQQPLTLSVFFGHQISKYVY